MEKGVKDDTLFIFLIILSNFEYLIFGIFSNLGLKKSNYGKNINHR